MKTDLESYLAGLAGQERVFFCPNPGNAGDSLIACATFQLFEKLGVAWQHYHAATFIPDGATLIFGGGGSLLSNPTFSWGFIARHHAAVRRLIILPHTICGSDDLLGKLGPNVDLFTREAVSFDYVRQRAHGAHVFLADDLAFHLNIRQVQDAHVPLGSLLLSPHLSVKQMLRGVRVWAKVATTRPVRDSQPRVLHCFRTDQERTDFRRPPDNVDVSKIFQYGTATPDQAFCATHMILRFVTS